MFNPTKKYLKYRVLNVFSILITIYIIFTSNIYYTKSFKIENKNFLESFVSKKNNNKLTKINIDSIALEKKLNLDFLQHKIFSEKTSLDSLNLVVTQEGKIIGCKINKINFVTYWSAGQSKQLVNKSILLTNFNKKLTIFSLKFILE